MACESIQISITTIVNLTLSLIFFVKVVSETIALSDNGVIVLFFRWDEAWTDKLIHGFTVEPLLSVSVFHM